MVKMKKFFLLLTTSLSVFLVSAQKYEDIKNMVLLTKFQQAKTELDKGMANAKFTAKPEAYILKSTVYSGLANSAGVKGTPQEEQLMTEAEAAYAKYKEMEPALTLVTDPVYQNAAINLYSSYYAG